MTRTPFGQMARTVVCDVCHGDGRVPKQPCRECRGRGRKAARRELDVDVPAGIADSQRIRLAERGHAGEAGAPAGDLYVLVRVREDERFVREGDALLAGLRRGRRGDLRVVVNVVIPRRLNEEQRELLERLNGTLTEENLAAEESMFAKLRRTLRG